MADKRWEWREDGTLVLAGVEYKLKPTGPKEISELDRMLHLRGEVWALLEIAKKSFASGCADYQRSFENASGLVLGFNQAEEAVESTFVEIGERCEPGNPFVVLKVDDRMRLALEIIQKLAVAAKG